MIGLGLVAMGSTDSTRLLTCVSIAQSLEWTGQTQKDLGSNPVKWRFSTHERKQDLINILLINTTISIVANRSGPTIV